MKFYDAMFKRKSVRKYDMTPLGDDQLNKIRQYADSMRPLYPSIKISYEITCDVKSLAPVKAPHYFVVMSENADGYLENAGFMFQQMDLFLTSIGLGSCWLGMAKPSGELQTALPFVITMAFGNAAENPYRESNDFKRKALHEISSGSDARIEAARVAPSAVNHQSWFFAADSGKIDVYQKKSALGIFDKTDKIDIGIAMCHLYVATENEGKEFVFTKETGKEKKGYLYKGTIS